MTRIAHLMACAALVALAAPKDQGSSPQAPQPPTPQPPTPEPSAEVAALMAELQAAKLEIDKLKAGSPPVTDDLAEQLSAIRAELEALKGEGEKPKPVQTVFDENAEVYRLGAGVFHQVQLQARPMSVGELAALLKVSASEVVTAAEVYDYLDINPPNEGGAVTLKAA
jgi:hypothetical protein